MAKVQQVKSGNHSSVKLFQLFFVQSFVRFLFHFFSFFNTRAIIRDLIPFGSDPNINISPVFYFLTFFYHQFQTANCVSAPVCPTVTITHVLNSEDINFEFKITADGFTLML